MFIDEDVLLLSVYVVTFLFVLVWWMIAANLWDDGNERRRQAWLNRHAKCEPCEKYAAPEFRNSGIPESKSLTNDNVRRSDRCENTS